MAAMQNLYSAFFFYSAVCFSSSLESLISTRLLETNVQAKQVRMRKSICCGFGFYFHRRIKQKASAYVRKQLCHKNEEFFLTGLINFTHSNEALFIAIILITSSKQFSILYFNKRKKRDFGAFEC